jgi:5'-nucleotidase
VLNTIRIDHLTKEDWNTWELHTVVKPECGNKIYHYIENPKIYDSVLPINGALARINILKQYWRVIFVTTSTNGTGGRKFRWLKDWKFNNSLDNYYECRDKSLIYSDYLIDDSYENVIKPVPYGGRINILFNQPWNEKFEYSPRMKDWNTFYDFI